MNEPINNNQDIPEVPSQGDLEKKWGECEMKRDEYLAGWQRAKADFINYKRDESKRIEEAMRYSNEAMMEELIRVLDNFDLGLRAFEKQGPLEKGIYMIRAQIEDTLKRFGLTKISVVVGAPLDPTVAEAIAEGDGASEKEYPPGSVLEEIEPGYKLFDKVIRPARVKVAKQKS